MTQKPRIYGDKPGSYAFLLAIALGILLASVIIVFVGCGTRTPKLDRILTRLGR